jgi:YesN/AraC family two-component response regulator
MYKILLVDDDKAIRYLYSKMKVWSQCGFEISMEASNGKEALEILQDKQFDLVVTDIRMPFVDGIELLRAIKERNIDTCIVFVSSYNDFEYARQGLILGAFDYVLKPTKEPQLHEVLSRAKTYLDEKYSNIKVSQGVLNALQVLNLQDDNAFIHKVCLYFTENYGKLVTMDTIAEYFTFNKDYFGKVFKQNTNVTFNYFNSLVKMEYAKELIKTGNYKAYEISEILGYSSVDYFTKVFKDITGETPSQYKNHA